MATRQEILDNALATDRRPEEGWLGAFLNVIYEEQEQLASTSPAFGPNTRLRENIDSIASTAERLALKVRATGWDLNVTAGGELSFSFRFDRKDG